MSKRDSIIRQKVRDLWLAGYDIRGYEDEPGIIQMLAHEISPHDISEVCDEYTFLQTLAIGLLLVNNDNGDYKVIGL